MAFKSTSLVRIKSNYDWMGLVGEEESCLLEVEFWRGGWLESIGSRWDEGREGLSLGEIGVIGLDGVSILVF